MSTSAYLKQWRKANAEYCSEYNSTYYKKHKKSILKNRVKYNKKHKKKILTQSKQWRKANLELVSVKNHYQHIVVQKEKWYKNMPFFNDWNPKKGGSNKAGANWIIANLGKRPRGSTLHIVDHEKGFVPGNLEWAQPHKQSNQQMFKIIADQKHQIKQLKSQIKRLKEKQNGKG